MIFRSRNLKVIRKFGFHLKNLREGKGFTQKSLAHEANVPISQIGRIERGEINPTLSTVYTLSTALKMPLAKVLDF